MEGGLSSENFNFKPLEEFVNRWVHKFIPETLQEENIVLPQQKGKNYFLFFLKILPWITLLIFIISIFYDPFLDWSINFPWREESLPLKGILRMLAVTGLVGFGTNYIAIKMLFHPREKRPLLGQGLIPASKIKIAYRLGEAINREIINPQLIVKQIKETGLVLKYMERFNLSLKETIQLPEFQKDLMELIEHYINALLRTDEFRQSIKNFLQGIDFENLKGIEAGLFKIYRFLGGDKEIAQRIEEIILSIEYKIDPHEKVIQEYLQKLPHFIDENKSTIEDILLKIIIFLVEKINVKKVIINNLLEFDELRLENLILYSTSDQLDYIQYLGCLLGILGGLFIWIPYESFVFLVFLGVLIFGLDEILYRIRKNEKSKHYPT